MKAKELVVREKVGDRIHEVMEWWANGLLNLRNGYILTGKAIYHLKKERLWRHYGSPSPSWKYWVEHELHVTCRHADRLAMIYVELGHLLPDILIDISKVATLLPYIHGKTDEEKVEMLNMAKDLRVEDIKNNIHEMKGEAITDGCDHPDTELISRCRICGKWIR